MKFNDLKIFEVQFLLATLLVVFVLTSSAFADKPRSDVVGAPVSAEQHFSFESEQMCKLSSEDFHMLLKSTKEKVVAPDEADEAWKRVKEGLICKINDFNLEKVLSTMTRAFMASGVEKPPNTSTKT